MMLHYQEVGSPVVKGEVEHIQQRLPHVLAGVSWVCLLPARGGELIDEQSSHAVLQWICSNHPQQKP